MQELRDKVAVITGGASGIGRAFADRCLEEGVKMVLADIEQAALDKAAEELANAGADVLAVRTDVSKSGSVEDLAKRVLDRYGAVHLLFNNAGVASSGPVWQNTLADWEWVLGVNLMGVVHGIRTFVPIMLSQDADAHIVNTASMAGLLSTPGLGIYNVTKHGVVTLSETLALELQQAARTNQRVGVVPRLGEDPDLGFEPQPPGRSAERTYAAGVQRPRRRCAHRADSGGDCHRTLARAGGRCRLRCYPP